MKVVPPSLETDTEEITSGPALMPRESLYATTTWLGSSGLARTECLRLSDVGKTFSAGNQIHVRAAKHQGRSKVLHKLRERTGIGQTCFRVATLCLAAVNHDRAGPEVLHPIDAELANLGAVEHCRNERTDGGLGRNLIFARRWGDDALSVCGAHGWIRRGQQRQRQLQRGAINRPTKTRRLKNADCEVDFFFMNGYEVDGV